MKRRLNLLCILVMLIMAGSFSMNIYYSGIGVKLGMDAVRASERRGKMDVFSNIQIVGLFPTGEYFMTDSVYNEKTESYIPAAFTQGLVSLPQKRSFGDILIIAVLNLVNTVAFIAALVFFFKFIIAVNRSYIFTWKNVSRLRWIGVLLIITFIISLVVNISSIYSLSEVLKVRGYELYFADMISVTNLLLGVLSFIIAEVFAIGLRLQEEQELTI